MLQIEYFSIPLYMKTFDKQFLMNMFSGPVSMGLGILATLVGYPIYLRYLGFELYGDWIVLSTILAMAQLGNLGIQPTIIKLISEAQNNDYRIQKIVTNSLFLLIISGSIILFLIIIFRAPIIGLFNLSIENELIVLSLLPYVGVLSVFVIFVQSITAILAGFGRYDLTNYFQSINRIIIVIIATVFLAFDFRVKGLLAANLIGYLIILIGSLTILKYKHSNIKIFRIANISKNELFKIVRFGFPIMGSSFVRLLLSPFNKLIITRYIGVEFLPIYEISYNGTMQFRNIFESGVKSLLPAISKQQSLSTSNLKQYIQMTIVSLTLVSIPTYTVLYIFSDFLLSIWLSQNQSPEFLESFRIILLGSFSSLAGVISYYYLIAMGFTKNIFIANVIQACSNFLAIATILLFFQSALSIQVIMLCTSAGMLITTIYLIAVHLKFRSSQNT